MIAIVAAVLAGGNRSAKSASAIVADAPGRTTGSGTVHSSMTETLSVDGQTRPVIDLEADADQSQHRSIGHILTPQGTVAVTMRTIGSDTYIQSPRVTLPRGAHWLVISEDDTTARRQFGSNDPSTGLRFLSGLHGDPRRVGTEVVNGADATHYALTLDMNAVLDEAAQQTSRLGVDGLTESLAQVRNVVDMSNIPGDVWIDSAGRVRRFRFTIHADADGSSVTAVATIDFSKFGEPLTVDQPSSDDTLPFRDDPTFFQDFAANTATPSA